MDFGFDFGSNTSGGAAALGIGTGFPASVISSPTAAPSTSDPWWSKALDQGTKVLGTVLGYELQKKQISAGQVPSIGYNPATNAPQGQNVASQIAASVGLGATTGASWLWLILLVVFVLMLLRR